MELGTVGFIIWTCACALGAVGVVVCRQSPSNQFWTLYLQYLLTQVAVSIVFILQDVGNVSDGQKDVLVWLTYAGLLYAASVYFRIGNKIIFRHRHPVHVALFVTSWIVLAVFEVALALTVFASGESKLAPVIMFAFYFPCALYGYVGIWIVCFKVWRTRNRPTDGALVQGSRNSLVSCTGRGRVCVILGLVGGTVGMLDFVIPALPFVIDVDLWEATFMTRLLDSVLYVPLFVPFILWLDDARSFLCASSEEERVADGSAGRQTRCLYAC